MKKKEISVMFAQAFEIPIGKAARNFDAFLQKFVDQLFEVGELNIPEFGKFKLKVTENKACMNPKTGEKIEKPLSVVVSFIPRKLFTHKLYQLGARTRRW